MLCITFVCNVVTPSMFRVYGTPSSNLLHHVGCIRFYTPCGSESLARRSSMILVPINLARTISIASKVLYEINIFLLTEPLKLSCRFLAKLSCGWCRKGGTNTLFPILRMSSSSNNYVSILLFFPEMYTTTLSPSMTINYI
jgi:hypothetical protein